MFNIFSKGVFLLIIDITIIIIMIVITPFELFLEHVGLMSEEFTRFVSTRQILSVPITAKHNKETQNVICSFEVRMNFQIFTGKLYE